MSHVVSVPQLIDTDSQPRYHREGKIWHGGRISIKIHLGSLLFERPHPTKGSCSWDRAAAEIARWEERDFHIPSWQPPTFSPNKCAQCLSLSARQNFLPVQPDLKQQGISKSRSGLGIKCYFSKLPQGASISERSRAGSQAVGKLSWGRPRSVG